MDHAGTTPTHPDVVQEMIPYFTEKFGNASTLYSIGREAREALETSRERISNLIKAKREEIYFTSGGTESDNWAIKGLAFSSKNKGKHIITSSIEHHAVLDPCEYLKKSGFDVTFLEVDKYGLVDPKKLEDAIRKDTILVSIMHANNEIGTIEPIEELARITKDNGVYFHTDAVQTVGKIEVNIEKLDVDMLSLSSHKIYGPKGVGALYIRKGTKIDPQMHGGGQERGMRSGTENIAGIVGLGKACEIAQKNLKNEEKRLTNLRDNLISSIFDRIDKVILNGHPKQRLPHNLNVSIEYIEGESLILRLDEEGISASTGSACSSRSLEPSHVLLAIGLTPVQAHGSLRLTLGMDNKKEDVDYVLDRLPKIVGELREISPLYTRRE